MRAPSREGGFIPIFMNSLCLAYTPLSSAAVRMESMQDLLMVALTVIFFTVALLYVRGCEKLR